MTTGTKSTEAEVEADLILIPCAQAYRACGVVGACGGVGVKRELARGEVDYDYDDSKATAGSEAVILQG